MIQIFSIDNTSALQWGLPFIRLGRYPFSASSILDNVLDNVNDSGLPLDMINAIYWIYKHQQDFGNPDFIGICHYRRFFSRIKSTGIIRISNSNIDLRLIADPFFQLYAIKQNNANGIITFPYYEDFFKNPKSKGYGQVSDYEYAWEGTYYQLKTDNVGLTLDEVKLAYDKLLEFSDDSLKPYIINAFKQKTVHFCSIFTLSKPLFQLYCKTALKAVMVAISLYDKNHLFNDCNCRVAGYLLERIGSCLFHALKDKGVKLISMPIIESESGKNPMYRRQTCKDLNMRFNYEILNERINSI